VLHAGARLKPDVQALLRSATVRRGCLWRLLFQPHLSRRISYGLTKRYQHIATTSIRCAYQALGSRCGASNIL